MTEERRLVTVLFADVSGSTGLGESLDPEDLRALLARYYAIAREVVSSHGGTIEKFIGDANEADRARALFERCDAMPYVARAQIEGALLRGHAAERDRRTAALEEMGEVEQLERYARWAGEFR